jgi:hypothetical protein
MTTATMAKTTETEVSTKNWGHGRSINVTAATPNRTITPPPAIRTQSKAGKDVRAALMRESRSLVKFVSCWTAL